MLKIKQWELCVVFTFTLPVLAFVLWIFMASQPGRCWASAAHSEPPRMVSAVQPACLEGDDLGLALTHHSSAAQSLSVPLLKRALRTQKEIEFKPESFPPVYFPYLHLDFSNPVLYPSKGLSYLKGT